MGETSADLERELVGVRDGISATVQELERRARNAVDLVDLKEQARQRPALVGGAGLALVGGASLLTFRTVVKRREARRPVNRLRRLTYDLIDDLGRRIDQARDSRDAGRQPNDRSQAPSRRKEKPGMIKSLLWMGLTAGTLALAGLLTRRLCSAVWQAVMHEPPPTAKV